MANNRTTIGDVLDSTFRALAGGAAGPEVVSLAEQLRQMQEASQALSQVSQQNTRAVERNTSAQGGSAGGSVGRVLQGFFGSGLGLSPLVSGLARLFTGGNDAPAIPSVATFSLPPSLSVSAGVSGRVSGGPFAVDSAQGNLPRAVSSSQVTVNVQAMDSRSFLDHSQDIARAVRQAMLESGVLTDVIREA